tara:strand:+ start:1052 stop:1873 length:822 start_codon:yes stop_codon:yes gene_type:complete
MSKNNSRLNNNNFFLKNKYFYLHLLFASIVTLCFFWLTFQPFLNWYTLNGQEFKLKDYYGLTVEEASNQFKEIGLKYEVLDSVFTDSVPKGSIYNQNPKPGTLIKQGRLIYFTVNRTTFQKFIIPDVYNKSEREAINQLSSHFELNIKRGQNYSSEASVVTMLKVGNHEVFPGQELIQGTEITVYFGLGRSSSNIIVPLLIGSSTQASQMILEQNNLKLGLIIAEGKILDTLNAMVVNQRPLSESKLQAGDMVDIVIKQLVDSLPIIDSIIIE